MKNGMKRLVSGLLAIAMVLTMFGVNTKTASAEENAMQSYEYDGYNVEFDVTDAWDGAFNADVKIANTGDAEICDWALDFEFSHEIQNLWNATVVEHTGNTYVIKNADWNANIKPDESVTFGMTVLCDGEISFPENFSFVMEEESVTTQNYSAEFTLYSDWGTGCNGAIVLSNLTDEPIENWQLEFDYDREIVDIANAVIVSHEQGHYVIKNAEYNADIAANSSVHISIVAGEGAAEERPENFTMQQTVVGDTSTGEEDGSEEIPDEPDLQEAISLYVLGKYNAENHSIDMEWYTNATEPEVTVWTSEDNVTYEQEATVTGVATYQYVITEEFETKYFKASVVDEQGDTVETVPFVVVKNQNGYSLSALDSDGDGVADEYELLAGTDVNNPDTDGDTLTDYEELYISQTDATKYDSVTEGLSDAEADSDGDKLSNREEIEYATDVQDADTDNDDLTDYEENEVYNTDPLKDDTDGDTLKDGDEIALGLDPLNPMTFGVPDAEYTVEQTISADSEALEEINTDENDYRLSVDVTASGYVEGNLTAKETGYAVAIQNEFMVGIASELSYTKEDGIESVTLTFELDEEAIGDSLGLFPGVEELSGIKRFNVFKYFEELNMLLPIETVVDEENNRIYATTDELGIYCVMDMERWLASFEVPEEVYQEPPVVFSLRPEVSEEETTNEKIVIDCVGTPQDMEFTDVTSEAEEFVAEEALADVSMMFAAKKAVDKTPLDVVFLLQSSGQLENTFLSQKTMIYELMVDLTAEYGRGNVRFAVITYNLSGAEFLPSTEGDIWFTTAYGLRQALNDLTYEYTTFYTDRGNAFQKLQNEVRFKENASKFIFQVMNGSTSVGNMYFDQINTCAKLGINYSELIPEGYFYASPSYGQQVADAIASTNGINVTYGSGTQYEVFMHIYNNAVPPQIEFDAIVPTGWKHIVLDGILDPDNGVNSDTDELTDWEEVNTERISWDTDGSVFLPTVQECIGFVEKTYAEDGLTRYKASQQAPGMSTTDFEKYLNYVLNSTHILPIYSDPTNVDTDGDGLDDCVEMGYGTNLFSVDTDGDSIDDEEEVFLGLDPVLRDTDGDSLHDGAEYALGYNPLDPNPDGDDYNDLEEFNLGKDPYVYEWEMTVGDHVGAVSYGVIFGDFADDDLINADVLIGQIGGSCFPVIPDIRDAIANAIKGDWVMVGMSGVGLFPVFGDGAKVVANLGQTVAKMGDDIPAITKLVVGVVEEHPSIVKHLGKSDEVVEAIQDASKSKNITKESLEKVMKCADEANIDILKTSKLFGKSDNVLENVDELAGVWNKGACKRGDIIDRYINKHVGGQGLGRTFPIADRVDKRVLISTKSIDLGANSYKDANTLRKRIQSYINKLDGIEDKYRDIMENGLQWTKDSRPLHYTDYDSKLVEIVIPDIPLSTKQMEVIQEFLDAGKISIIIIK